MNVKVTVRNFECRSEEKLARYIVDKDDERFCHIFIKDCTDEDYTGFFQTVGYIEQKATPVCGSEQYCIRYEIPETGDIRKSKRRHRENVKKAVRVQRGRNY